MSKEKNTIQLTTQDGVMWWVEQMADEATSIAQKRDVVEGVARLLSEIPDQISRSLYVEDLAKNRAYPYLNKVELKKAVERSINDKYTAEIDKVDTESEYLAKFPEGKERDFVMMNGFYPVDDRSKTKKTPGDVGYWFLTQGKGETQVSNFVIKLLFHVDGAEDNKRLVELYNGYETKIIDVPSKSLISLEQFSAMVFEKGYFLFEGAKPHLLKINRAYGRDVPTCFELKTLGWQGEGFFAYSDFIFSDELLPMDSYGIVKHKDKNFFSPSASVIYKDMRDGDDPHENDRFLKYKETKVTFSEWAELFLVTYGKEKAMLGIGAALVSLFKDIVFKLDNNCPHFYAYGPSQSGKSKFMESISALFFDDLRAFSLASGTNFAFANRLERFRNCPAVFNEFDDNTVKDEWFQSIKTAYDGEGRERGKTNKKTEVQKINCMMFLLGQYLSQKDDNSILSRTVLTVFSKVERTQKVMDAYDKLKDYEEKGLNGILIELLKLRPNMEKYYNERFHQEFITIKEVISKRNMQYNERVVRNYCAFLTCTVMASETLSLPFEVDDLRKYVCNEVVKMSKMIKDSDALGMFWNTMVRLVDSNVLIQGWHYKVKGETSIKIRKGSDQEEVKFNTPKQILYLRLNVVQGEYYKAARQVRDSPLGLDTILHYLKGTKYYLGESKSQKFKRTLMGQTETKPTSSIIIDYDELEKMGIYLKSEKEWGPAKEDKEERDPITGEVISPQKTMDGEF